MTVTNKIIESVLGKILDVTPRELHIGNFYFFDFVFSYYDDAIKCGCWKESRGANAKRWNRPSRRDGIR